MKRLVIEADGGSRGNPGPAGFGAVVLDPDTGAVLAEVAEAIGVATNNVAEYGGLIAGLRAALDLGATDVEARMDSKLVVEQMSGRWQIKNPGLRPLAAQAAELVRKLGSVRFTWIPRERNTRADALANRAMDIAAGKPVRSKPVATADVAAPDVAAPDSPARAEARRVAAAAGGKSAWEPRTGDPLRLLLVRHGQTELNAGRRYSGRGDPPLTEVGQAQAQAIAARIGSFGVPLKAVVCSPLRRRARTADLIAADAAPVVIEPDLVECDFGDWEGLTFAEVRERWPDEMSAWLASTDVAPPGGESFATVGRRVARALARLRSTYPAGSVAVVSHVSPLKVILRDALDARDGFLHRTVLDPAGLSVVDFWPDGGVAVRSLNDTAHLR